MKKSIKNILIVLLLSCLFFACIEKENNDPELKTGKIVLNLPMLQLKSLIPGISMVPISYDINGTGPNGGWAARLSLLPGAVWKRAVVKAPRGADPRRGRGTDAASAKLPAQSGLAVFE